MDEIKIKIFILTYNKALAILSPIRPVAYRSFHITYSINLLNNSILNFNLNLLVLQFAIAQTCSNMPILLLFKIIFTSTNHN